MEYLKEFQAFAGRFSAVADERFNRIDGGTYTEFFRLYSRRWSEEVESVIDEEQWQIDILLEELELAMEAPELHSALSGTVLHTGATEAGVGPALSQVCVALEKCIFFGAKGSAPDFWWVLRRACGTDSRSADAAAPGTGSNGNGAGSAYQANATDQPDIDHPAAEVNEGSLSQIITSNVSELTRLQTGHGRCRAWARGLLVMDGAAAEEALQKAAEVVAQDIMGMAETGARESWNVEVNGVNSNGESAESVKGRTEALHGDRSGITSGIDVKQANPEACGSSIVSHPHFTCPDSNSNDLNSLPRGNLPLWLRPGRQGTSILQVLCKLFMDFENRLNDNGLSVRLSLDHAWLDQENIAAATTYTWPRFPKEELRCSVRGAGLAAVNGEYYPIAVEKDKAGGRILTLVGPNSCQISRQDFPFVGDLIANPATRINDLHQDPSSTAGGDQEERMMSEETASVASRIGTTGPPPTVQIWCLTVLLGPGQGRRVAYSCLGDSALPPFRGWRAADATEMPSPLLGFAVHTDGEMNLSVGENPSATEGKKGEAAEATFGPAVRAITKNQAISDITRACGPAAKTELDASAAGVLSTEACGDGLGRVGLGGHPCRRRKRRRPPERALSRSIDAPARATAGAAFDYKASLPLAPLGAGNRLSDGTTAEAGGEGFRAGSFSLDELDVLAGDERRFTAERWTLPAPNGELLLRAERTREMLRKAAEKREMILAIRRSKLLEEFTAAQGEYLEVMRESLHATVTRVLASRPGLREEAEEEMVREARIESMKSEGAGNGRPKILVPSLEELVAEKAEELRTRPLALIAPEATQTNSSADAKSEDCNAELAAKTVSPLAGANVGWPWAAGWLKSPLAPPSELGTESAVQADVRLGALGTGRWREGEPDDGDHTDTPPYLIEVAAVEVADMDDLGAAHVEYILRVVYREVRPVHENLTVAPLEDPKVTELRSLSAASKRLLQRTRVLSKRINSLCALHPKLMTELDLEDGRLVSPGGFDCMEHLAFPDPFELGTLEESILRAYRDPLTLRFKAKPLTRKLKAQVGSYLSGVLCFLGILEMMGHADTRARMSRVLNDALSICDRAGRKRRRGDFVIGVRIKDIVGGKLGSGKDDDQRLRTQGRRCMGCGRAIAAEFLGIKKDYFPCRYANGLFCRRICHSEDRRVVPHRVVHHWDFTYHRVCKDSAAFLDATRNLPIIYLPEECPRLVAEHQVLRLVRSRRKQLASFRQTIYFPTGEKCVAGARILEELLDGRMHLAEDTGLYSLEDLIMVKKGSLVGLIEETVEALTTHVLDDCSTCESRAAQVCQICYSSDLVFTFQAGTTARCPGCGNYFHAKCAEEKGAGKAGATGTKWWLDQTEGVDKGFECPLCKGASPLAEVTE